MDENAPLVLQGLRQMTQLELRAIDAACADAQAQARRALDQLPSQLQAAARQAVADADIAPEDFAEANWPATLGRMGRRVAARASLTAQQAAVDLQRQLFGQLASKAATLYRFGVAFDQLAQAGLGAGQPGDGAQSLLAQLGTLWTRYGGSGEPLDAQMLSGAAGQLAARLMPAELERRLLEITWPAAEPRPDKAASLRQALQAQLDDLIEQQLRDLRAELELALENHVRLIFNVLGQTLDECFAARRRALPDHAAGASPADTRPMQKP